jgi:YVTN family beta-propeller protein
MPQARPALTGNRAPNEIAFSPDGKTAYISEAAEGTVAVVKTGSFEVTAHLPTNGAQPAGLAVTPDGDTLVVCNSYSGSVSLIQLPSGKPQVVVLPGMPWGVCLSGDGKRAYVSLNQRDEVAVLDLPTGRVGVRIPVGRRPRALRLTPDGKTLAVANMSGGSVSVVNTETLKEIARVKLKGVNVRGLTLTADGTEAYATLMPAFNLKPTSDPAEMWHNLVQAVKLDGPDSAPAEDQWMDFARLHSSYEVIGTPDQYGIAVDAAGRFAWMASGGRDVLTRITIHDRRRDAIWPISQVEAPVGANPRGVALTPDGGQVWVANYLGNSVTVVDAATMQPLKTIALGPATKVDPTIAGQYLFNNAGMTRLHRFTCASCHPDGAPDGLTWSFVHVPDGYTRRNSRDLRTGVPETAPFRWSGYEKQLSDFVDDEVTGLLGGPKPTPEQNHALAQALGALQLPANPYRGSDGQFTAAALRGKSLFEGKAGCAACHTGPRSGGTGIAAWIGTTKESQKVDVPQLIGVYDGAPYLHDGRAATLEEIFSRFNERKLHGKADRLTADELSAVLHYVREL